MIADGTILRLHELLSAEFEARHEEQAGARLHLLHNVTDQTIDRFSITDEKAHVSTEFDTGSWLNGRLAILDLAYFKYRRFALIDENDGYFLSRLKRSANPVVTEELRDWRGRAIPVEGTQIFDVVDDLQRQYIDVEVEVEFDRRSRARSHGIPSGSVSSASATRTPTTTTCISRISREMSSCRGSSRRCIAAGGR